MSFKININRSEKIKGLNHNLLKCGSLIHIPLGCEIHILDDSILMRCKERNSYLVQKGTIIVLTNDNEMVRFDKGSEFFNARFSSAPNSKLIESHDCYGFQLLDD